MSKKLQAPKKKRTPTIQKARKKAAPKKAAIRARKVAEKVVQGKTQTAIADELAVSRKTVQRDLSGGGVQAVIIGLVNDHYSLINHHFELAMEALGAAFYAHNFQLIRLKVQVLDESSGEITEKDSYEIVDLGPDHYARLAAVKRHLEIVTAGRQSVKPQEKPQDARLLTIAALQQLASEEQNQ